MIQIRHRARDLEDAVVCAGGEPQSAQGHFERTLARIVQGAESAQGLRRNVGIVVSAPLL